MLHDSCLACRLCLSLRHVCVVARLAAPLSEQTIFARPPTIQPFVHPFVPNALAYTPGWLCVAGGVGFDINCGVRLVRTNLSLEEVLPVKEELTQSLFDHIPVGVGSKGVIPVTAADLNDILVRNHWTNVTFRTPSLAKDMPSDLAVLSAHST